MLTFASPAKATSQPLRLFAGAFTSEASTTSIVKPANDTFTRRVNPSPRFGSGDPSTSSIQLAPDAATVAEMSALAREHGYANTHAMWQDYFDKLEARYDYASLFLQASEHYSPRFTPAAAKAWVHSNTDVDNSVTPHETVFSCNVSELRKAFPGVPPRVLVQSIQAMAPATGYQLKDAKQLTQSNKQLSEGGVVYCQLERVADNPAQSKQADLMSRLDAIHNQVLFPEFSPDTPISQQRDYFNFRQGAMGNCYALSGIYNVLNNPNTRARIMNSFTTHPLGYNTRLTHDYVTPLDLPIPVAQADVTQGAKTLDEIIVKACETDNTLDDSTRWQLNASVGPLGVRVLERAYSTFQTEHLKATLNVIDTDPGRIQTASKAYYRRSLTRQLAALESEPFYQRDGGSSTNVLETMFNLRPSTLPDFYNGGPRVEQVRDARTLKDAGDDSAFVGLIQQDLEQALTAENKATNAVMLSAGTYDHVDLDEPAPEIPEFDGRLHVSNYPTVGLRPGHAYAMRDYDPTRQTIQWVDPHQTLAPIELSYADSARLFRRISLIHTEQPSN